MRVHIPTVLSLTSLSFFAFHSVFAQIPAFVGSVSALHRRDTDPFDHSDIKAWAAIGDSFSAGIGAGTRLKGWGDWYCSRYDSSYPSVLNKAPALGDSKGRTFQYYSCSGAITTDVTKSQVPSLKNPQMVTLTVGGNDAKLKDILAACIYNWNKDPQLDCDKTLAESQKTIDSTNFSKNFDDLMKALKAKMKNKDSKIYWTGYSHFWDDSTDQCDKVTWMFKYDLGIRQYLLQSRRKTMNQLVDAVNQKIQDAINRAGDQVIYVPWGADVDYIDGHYCEPGVDEWDAVNREKTVFYEWGTTIDDEGNPPAKDELKKRQDGNDDKPGQAPGELEADQRLEDTWEGQIANWVIDAIENKGAKPEDYGLSEEDVVQAQGGLLLPDKYGRVFHPQQYSHLMIAENILRTMDMVKAKSAGQKAATTTLIGCPAPTGAASHPGEHNQCVSDAPDPDEVTFTVSNAEKAIKDYCLKHKDEIVKVGDGDIVDTVPNGDDKKSALILQAQLNMEPVCQKYPNSGKWNFFDCEFNFKSAMNDCEYISSCFSQAEWSTTKTINTDPMFTTGDIDTRDEKVGGSRTADCIYYSIRASNADYATDDLEPDGEPENKPDEVKEQKCRVHVTQSQDYDIEGGGGDPFSETPETPLKYTVEVDIFNEKGDKIGHHDEAEAGDGNSLSVESDLEDDLVVTPEKQNDYIQFEIGGTQFASNDDGACEVGAWSPKEAVPNVSLPILFLLTLSCCT